MPTRPTPRPGSGSREPEALEPRLIACVEKTRADLVNCIVRAEQREQMEKDVRQEMLDFFEESARYAASVVGVLARERDARHNDRIDREVQEFFSEALSKAAALAERLRLDQANPAVVVEELEAVLRGVAGAVQRAARTSPLRPAPESPSRATPAPGARGTRSGGRKPARERPGQRVEGSEPRRRQGESRGQR